MAKIKGKGILNLLILLPSLVTAGAAIVHTVKDALKNKPPAAS